MASGAYGGASGARSKRRYGGIRREERDVLRYRLLLRAGLELFGTRGYAATSIAALCSEASVSTRNF